MAARGRVIALLAVASALCFVWAARFVGEGRLAAAIGLGTFGLAFLWRLSVCGIATRADRIDFRGPLLTRRMARGTVAFAYVSLAGNLVVKPTGRVRIVVRSVATFDIGRQLPDEVLIEVLERFGIDCARLRCGETRVAPRIAGPIDGGVRRVGLGDEPDAE